MIGRSLEIVPFLIAFSFCVAQPESPHAAHDVCDIIKNRDRYNSTVVSMKGTLVLGEHYLGLAADCPSSITTNGYTWPNVIHLVPAQGKDAKLVNKEKTRKALQGISPKDNSSKTRPIVTVTGRVESDRKLDAWRSDVGEWGASGYGFAGRFAVQVQYRVIER